MPARYVALVSGGCDSMVLLHALAEIRDQLRAPLAVLHFDHGLAPESADWAHWVGTQARVLDIPFFCETLNLEAGAAAETRAREARYGRLAACMQAGDCCLSAHHADDQAETFLLQALRGSGVAGLAAMPAKVDFGAGWLARPLLTWRREELRVWAGTHNLDWIEDPANQDRSVPRNWLRLNIWPLLAEHWSSAARTLGRTAGLAGDAAAILDELAAEDVRSLQSGDTHSLSIDPLLALSPPRRRNALRYWLRERDLPLPTAHKLLELEAGFIVHDPGGRAVLAWPGACVRRYRGRLFAHAPWPPLSAGVRRLVPEQPLDLGCLGRITLRRDEQGPLTEALVSQTLTIRFRAGGECLRPAGAGHHRTLKHLLQEQAVLPWMRDRLPLLYAGDELVAIPGVVEAAVEFSGTGWRLDWSGAPPLH
ncbi:MAG: tRNA lysidine(34) synthetase TilS [Gammaproteobacteria bacterium]